MAIKLEIVNNLKATVFKPPTYQWFLEVINGFVSNVNCNGGSSNSISVKRIKDSWSWTVAGAIPSGKIYGVDLTVSAPFQQAHTISNIQVSEGLTLTLVYMIPDPGVPMASYGYQLGSQPPVAIGTAVQGASGESL